jgi:hypothetical protein
MAHNNNDMGINWQGIALMKYLILIVLFNLSICGLYSNSLVSDSIRQIRSNISKTEIVRKDSHDDKDIKLPKFDVHLSLYDFYGMNLGVRALMIKNLSIEYSYGKFFWTDSYFQRFGFNYYFTSDPNWAITPLIMLINKKGNSAGYSLNFSYIPLTKGNLHFNCRIGLEHWNVMHSFFQCFPSFGIFYPTVDTGFSYCFP